jgi:DNA invertase Pin-like site-specific DNA recombinase
MAKKYEPAGSLTTALIYTRVSKDEQAREGLSLDAQLAECRRYAALQGWILGNECQDILKGTRDDRPQYQALLADVRRLRAEGRPLTVVVAALNRFGRGLLERVRSRDELKTLGVATHSVREGGEVSDIVANVLAAVAQEEVRRLGERVRATNQFIASGGWHHVGRAPWGYTWRPPTDQERAAGAPNAVLAWMSALLHVCGRRSNDAPTATRFVLSPTGWRGFRSTSGEDESCGTPPCA